MTEIPDCLKPPEMQCVNCWHRWKPEQHFRDTPRCPGCGSAWLVRVDYLNLALRLSRGEESGRSLEAYQGRMEKGKPAAIAALGIPPLGGCYGGLQGEEWVGFSPQP